MAYKINPGVETPGLKLIIVDFEKTSTTWRTQLK
jgi:hypothetical protein